MLKVNSLHIHALRGIPRIDENPFEQYQEGLGLSHPLDSSKKNYDSGKPRLTIPDLSPAGPNDISESADDANSHSNVSSGYNDGGQAKEEIGPGFTDVTPDPYYGTWAFNNENDPSTISSPLDSRKHHEQQLRRLYSLPPVKWKHNF